MSLGRGEDNLGKMGKDLPLFGLYSNNITNNDYAFFVSSICQLTHIWIYHFI